MHEHPQSNYYDKVHYYKVCIEHRYTKICRSCPETYVIIYKHLHMLYRFIHSILKNSTATIVKLPKGRNIL